MVLANELEIAILNLFIDIRTRYPNLIVGRLERDTVKDAMKNGITAAQVRFDPQPHLKANVTDEVGKCAQIISYLTTHAHPQMFKNVRISFFLLPRTLRLTRNSLVEPAITDHSSGPAPSLGPRTESTGQKPR